MTAEIAQERRDVLGFTGAAADFQREPRDGTVRLGQAFAKTKIAVDDTVQGAAGNGSFLCGNDSQQQNRFGGFSKERLREFFDD